MAEPGQVFRDRRVAKMTREQVWDLDYVLQFLGQFAALDGFVSMEIGLLQAYERRLTHLLSMVEQALKVRQ